MIYSNLPFISNLLKNGKDFLVGYKDRSSNWSFSFLYYYPNPTALVFGCSVSCLFCRFHRWPWLISGFVASISPTTPSCYMAAGNMDEQLSREMEKMIRLTEDEESTVKVPANLWANS